VTCGRSVVFSGFLRPINWQPQYNWNIVESGIKHNNPNPLSVFLTDLKTFVKSICIRKNIYDKTAAIIFSNKKRMICVEQNF
jgi:hypothetical protein